MARSFNGTSNRITLSKASLTGIPVTISAWINPSSLSSAQREIFIIQLSSFATIIAIEYRPDLAGNTIYGNFNGASGNAAPFATAQITNANQWYHGCVIAYSATSTAAFLNGGNKGTSAVNFGTQSAPNLSFIGSYNSGGFFAGSIADVAVWNVALSDAEVTALAQGIRPQFVRPASLVGWWPLDGILSPESDLSGNRNNGVLTGTTLANGPPITLFTPKNRTPPDIFTPVAGGAVPWPFFNMRAA